LTEVPKANKKFFGGPGGGFSKKPPGRREQRYFHSRRIFLHMLGVPIHGRGVFPGSVHHFKNKRNYSPGTIFLFILKKIFFNSQMKKFNLHPGKVLFP
jgi:hypothetical protein